jgi:outer membrane biosynthesis protein TonB
VLPSFGPPEMPAPAAAAPGHPQPPGIPSIATAETVATPELQGHLAIQPPSPMLIMPPGITVVPSLPPAVLQSADGDFDDDHHVDPSEVVAIRRGDQRAESRGGHRVESRAEPRGDQRTGTSRDVLAGWGWTTGASAIIDDSDHFEDHARASRKRLVIAIGGALAGVLVIAGIAFAFRSPAAVEPAAAPSATALSATAPSATAAVAPEPAASAAAVATNPAPTPVEPAPPAEPAKVDPPSAEPAKPEPVAVAPPVAPPPPVRPEPAKVAAVAKPAPAKPAPLRAEAKKLEAKKPEPKAVDKAVKRPQVARVATKAQPVDPYGIPNERTRPDPAAAYRTGLQQYAHGDTTGALATFRASLAGNPGFAPTWRGLGLVYEKLGNKGQARVAFRRYLQLAPAASDAEQIRERVGRLGS